ncbi:CLUMA_CG011964, isoform A [Clunio marinus]|uniref:CLUMA_CG011964, isoform A n=1 Tax=Clunio marinus TaxID=568069 RepID=A0A1J1IEC6_9DIPT|nr:CLUMA_CG011964, isoform A [Clunio marinus]
MSIEVKLIVFAILSYSTTAINGVIQHVEIEIQEDVPADNCKQFIETFKNVLKLSSEQLHSSLDERIQFGSFNIILPSTWSNDCASNATVNNHNGAPIDVKITDTHPIFGDSWWTLQTEACKKRGIQIASSYKNIEDNIEDAAEKFAEEWAKYRYGVFDVHGFVNDSVYPSCHPDNPLCYDAIKLEFNTTNSSYFTLQNPYLPSKQNFMCHRQSPIDIIAQNSDFIGVEGNQPLLEPTFTFSKKKMTRYMVIIDEHIDISIRDSFQFLRDAIRKWIEKDLSHDFTEVGIYLMANASKSDDPDRKLIKSLQGSDNREEIFSILPWYIESSGRSVSKCMINNAVSRSIGMLDDRTRTHGAADSVILIIGPGMFSCQDDSIIMNAIDRNIKISTINYPIIGPNRVDMSHLAYKTGGEAFTVMEQKQNEVQSLLTTFFELSNVLMHISAVNYHGDSSLMPVEIYRKELLDSGSREENRVYFDSFNVDEATEKINFFIYIYDRKERNIENGMKLISPNNKEFSTFSELRAEYHQLAILGNLTGYGSWSYNLKRFFGSPQNHFVQVLAYPKPNTQNFIRAKAWTNRPQGGNPIIIFVQVMQGNLPINDALVEISVTGSNGHNMKIQLFDNGSGDPDITKGDGIYTRYFIPPDVGMWKFQIYVNDNGNTAYVAKENTFLECCGSVIPTSSKLPVTSFQRYLVPMTIFINRDEVAEAKSVLHNIGRIGDLRVLNYNSSSDESKATLEWSGPDVGVDNIKIDYEIRATTGPISNYVRVFIPKKRAITSSNTPDNNSYPSLVPSYDDVTYQNNQNEALLSIEIVILLIVLLAIIFISILCWCCCRRKRKSKKNEKSENIVKSPVAQQNSISIISPPSSQNYNFQSPEAQNNYYTEQPTYSIQNYMDEIPCHQTVGLPIEDDMNSMYIDESEEKKYMKAIRDTYDQNFAHLSNGSLTANGKFLSPYESWTPSQLLHEHDRRHEVYGEIVPPIPPHPYQNNYGYTSSLRAPPPQYSSVNRSLLGQGSMQSVDGGTLLSSDRKKRSVTMV